LKLVAARPAQSWPPSDPRWALSAVSFGKLDEVLAKQWLVVCERPR
jgi:hypothetical protein